MADTDITTKRCTKCGEIKPKTEFAKDSERLSPKCKTCVNAYASAYRAANRDKIKLRNASQYAKNREKALAYRAEYYSANKDKVKRQSAEWRAANQYADKVIRQNRRAKMRAANGRLSGGLAKRLYKLQKGKCACCGKPLGDDYHLDHIMPLALGGSNTDDNMQLLTSRCNIQKNAKHPVDFMQQRGFLL